MEFGQTHFLAVLLFILNESEFQQQVLNMLAICFLINPLTAIMPIQEEIDQVGEGSKAETALDQRPLELVHNRLVGEFYEPFDSMV